MKPGAIAASTFAKACANSAGLTAAGFGGTVGSGGADGTAELSEDDALAPAFFTSVAELHPLNTVNAVTAPAVAHATAAIRPVLPCRTSPPGPPSKSSDTVLGR
ncbi:hypothetical protein GCM10023205_23920 [Yinghuangia aomiensis]|uniref:Uncharacterized protein n=1 Tax=Yinghuangia aomiensis TaxID=676205 RepID=A0ABP9H5C4_9ACTN